MVKYRTKIKAQINIYKEIEVEADDYISAKQQVMQLSSKMLDDSREVIENNDKDIKRNMSYWSYNKIEEINKGEIIMNKEKKEQLLMFIESAIKHLNNIQESVKKNQIVKDLDWLCVERDTKMLLDIIKK